MVTSGAPGPPRGSVALELVGWGDRWEALLAEAGTDVEAARVLRHDGVAVTVLGAGGERAVPLRRGLEPVAVGDWLALRGDHIAAVLPRASILRRRAAGGDGTQLLATNLDLVLLVCGLDRPVRSGRIQRGEALAWDAGATPVLILTKADVMAEELDGGSSLDAVVERVERDHPGLEVIVASVRSGVGMTELVSRLAGATAVLLGESGAGKSSLVNALLGTDTVSTREVRAGDAKGRHTTTSRQLHLLDGGGVLIDTPGIREVGLAGDEEAVDATFDDIDELALDCRFHDCGHDSEPDCGVLAAVEDGRLDPKRLSAFRELRREAEAAALRADEHERRAHERRASKGLRATLDQKYGDRDIGPKSG